MKKQRDDGSDEDSAVIRVPPELDFARGVLEKRLEREFDEIEGCVTKDRGGRHPLRNIRSCWYGLNGYSSVWMWGRRKRDTRLAIRRLIGGGQASLQATKVPDSEVRKRAQGDRAHPPSSSGG